MALRRRVKTGLILVGASLAVLLIVAGFGPIGDRPWMGPFQGDSASEGPPACRDENSPTLPDPLAAPTLGPGLPRTTIDFDSLAVGTYTAAQLGAQWGQPEWSSGVEDDRVSIVAAGDRGNALRVLYPSGSYGAEPSGAQWQLDIEPSQAAYVSYFIRFGSNFDFVRGGKLPGLAGGTANVGGNRPNGTDGWSARMMWRESGCAVYYVYHPDQPGQFGEDLDWQVAFEPDRWHRLEHVIVMNTPGVSDGVALGWIDGELTLERRDLRFRDVNSLGVDMLFFSTFFGGADISWAPALDQFVDFDDFVISAVSPESVEREDQP